MVEIFNPGPIQQFQTRRQRYGATTSPTQGAIASELFNQSDVRIFALRWPSAPKSVKDALQAHHDATLGGTLTMEWTLPSTEVVRVRFVKGREGYSYDRKGPREYSISVLLEEAPEYRNPSSIT